MGDILFIGGDRRMICAAELISQSGGSMRRSGWAAISLSLKTSRADTSG